MDECEDKSAEKNVEGFCARLVWMFSNGGRCVERDMDEIFYVYTRAISG